MPVNRSREVKPIHRGHKYDAAHSIDFYAYESRLRSWNAGLKMAVGMAALCLCIAADKLSVSVFVIFTMACITVMAGGLSPARYLKLLTIPLAFLFMGTVAIAIGISRRPCGDWYISVPWFSLYVTKAGLLQAVLLFARALGAVSAMYMMTLSTPASEMIGVLKRIHVPKMIVELMYLIYRFIFVLSDTHSQMKQAAVSRLGTCDFRTSCRTFGSTAGNLLVASLKKADTYYDSLLSRCYDGDLCFLEEEKRIRGSQAAAAAGYLLLILAVWIFL